ncbi:MAG: VanZ family protein [Bacilli bacterium]|nr:VanZ family protein [Bacilli bacterium]
MIRQSLLKIFGEVWPTILISAVIAISMRIVYLIKNKEKIVFYKEFLALVFIIYVLCLFYVVTFQDVGYSSSNFVPFKEIFRYSLGSRLFIKNVLGNIILFMPYGYFVSYYLNLKKPISAFFMVLLVSASVEVIQLLIGRIFDIDDIILNVIGGLFGFYIYKFFNVINEHLPSILKNPIVYNIMILLVVAIMALYMFNLIGVGF